MRSSQSGVRQCVRMCLRASWLRHLVCDSLWVYALKFPLIIAQAVYYDGPVNVRVSVPSDQSVCPFTFRVTLHISVACTGFLQQVPSPTSTQYVPLKYVLQSMLPWWSDLTTSVFIFCLILHNYLHSWGRLKLFFCTQEASKLCNSCSSFLGVLCWGKSSFASFKCDSLS